MGIVSRIHKLFHYWDTRRFIRNIKFLIKNDLTDFHADLIDEILEDCVFELDELRDYILPRAPKILDRVESLAVLENQPKSFVRFGDGEVDIMEGRDTGFQKYDPVLAEKMLRVLKTKRDDLYVGINRTYFHSVLLRSLTVKGRKFGRLNSSRLRDFFIREANPEIQYLDACCLTGYFVYDDDNFYGELIRRKRKLFEGRKIALVTGRRVLEKLDYDIFELAASKVIIEAPSKNAFSSYDEILSNISSNISKDTLICLILGQTAKAMTADLTDMGYLACDVGHIAKDYDAYVKKIDKYELKDFFAPD